MREVTQFFDRLRGYLGAPRDHGPELLVSVGLLLAVLGLVIIFGLWVRFRLAKRKYEAIERARKRAESPPIDDFGPQESATASEVPASVLASASPWPWRLTIVVVLLFLTLLVAANAVPRYTLGNVSYCGYCHKMNKAVISWRTSKHSKVPCQACHERPGVTGIVLSQLQGLSNISLSSIYWSRQRPLALKGPVSPACLSCHQDIGKKTVKFRDSIRVSHREFIASVGCETCHPSAGHDGKRLTIKIMDKCIECHTANHAGVACNVCHIAEPAWSKVRLSKYRKAPISFKSCTRCHPTEMRCSQCH